MPLAFWNNSPKALPPEPRNTYPLNRDQLKKPERDLWAAADKLGANSDLKASEHSTPVLGLIFLKLAEKQPVESPTANRAKRLEYSPARLPANGLNRASDMSSRRRGHPAEPAPAQPQTATADRIAKL